MRERIHFKTDPLPRIAKLMAEEDRVATGIVINLIELVRDTEKVVRTFRCLNCMNIRGFQLFLWYRYIHTTYNAKTIEDILDLTLDLTIKQQKLLTDYINSKVNSDYRYSAHVGMVAIR